MLLPFGQIDHAQLKIEPCFLHENCGLPSVRRRREIELDECIFPMRHCGERLFSTLGLKQRGAVAGLVYTQLPLNAAANPDGRGMHGVIETIFVYFYMSCVLFDDS